MINIRRRIKGLFGTILCLSIVWGGTLTAYAATHVIKLDGGINAAPVSCTSNTLKVGTILEEGQTIEHTKVEVQGSGYFKIFYYDENENKLQGDYSTNYSATRGANDSEYRTLTVGNDALTEHHAWQVMGFHFFKTDDIPEFIYYIINVKPYQVPPQPVVTPPTEPAPPTEKTYIDYDTFKSDYGAGTVYYHDSLDSACIYDLKAHAVNDRDSMNQQLLADAYMKSLGALGAKMIATKGLYPYWDVSKIHDGAKCKLSWKNTGLPAGTTVYAVCYNQIDGAYYLPGIVNQDGTVVFEGYIVRDATNVSVVVPQ